MVITTPSTIMPPPTGDKYKAQNAFWGIFDFTVTLTLDFLILKFDAIILALKLVGDKSLVKFRQQILKVFKLATSTYKALHTGHPPYLTDLLQCHKSSCLLYTSPSPRDRQKSRMPSSA